MKKPKAEGGNSTSRDKVPSRLRMVGVESPDGVACLCASCMVVADTVGRALGCYGVGSASWSSLGVLAVLFGGFLLELLPLSF